MIETKIPARITHVAIRFNGEIYSLPSPNRHHDVIRYICETTGATHVDVREDDQGFLDVNGVYLRRAPALARAHQTGQLKPGTQIHLNRLFSENVW